MKPAAVDAATGPRAKPIVKWAGGKTRLLPELLKRLPKPVAELRYVEPFLGGGALFFALAPERARLADANAILIEALRSVRDEFEVVIAELEALEKAHSLETFERTRSLLNNPHLPSATRAAAFFYLNRTGFNGLYRVNKKGGFNVPFGHYKNPKICNREALWAASNALQPVELLCQDFEQALSGVGYGDFVYLDPPYVPTSETASFTAYTNAGFTDQDQMRLAQCFRDCAERGAFVMLSQADHDFVRRLYKGFRIEVVENSRSVSAKGASRGKVSELLVRNYR